MPYIGNQPGTGVRNRFIYTATASQTTFSGADNNGKTLKYADSDFVDVFLNGVCLVPAVDYTSTTKTSVVLTQAASLNDTLEVVAYDIATIADTVSKADGGTFEGDLGITSASPDIILTNNTTEDTDGGRESTVTFKGLQSGGEESTLAQIQASHDATADDQKGDLIFKTNDGSDGVSPTEAMRIDSDGSVGIGATTITSPAGFSKTVLSLAGSTAPSVVLRQAVGNEMEWGLSTAGGFFSTAHAQPLRFATNNTERMRIDDSGVVFIGTTTETSSAKLQIVSSNTFFGFVDRAQVSTGNPAGFFNQAGSQVGSISTTSSSTSFNESSDYRLKENVADISDGITRVKQLAPKRFNFIVDADTTVDGFLAHEAATVVPEAVTGTKDEVEVWREHEKDELPDGFSVGDNKLDDDGNTIPKIQGIDKSKLVPLLTAALQEAIAKIETLETKVAALEAG